MGDSMTFDVLIKKKKKWMANIKYIFFEYFWIIKYFSTYFNLMDMEREEIAW